MLWHPLAAMARVPGLTDVIIIGFYEDSVMSTFIRDSKREFPNITISYLREYRPLGTAGGLYHCESNAAKDKADDKSVTPSFTLRHPKTSLSATLMSAAPSRLPR